MTDIKYNAKAFSGFLKTVPKLGDLRILEILGEYDADSLSGDFNTWTGLKVLVYNEARQQFSEKNIGLDKKKNEFYFDFADAKGKIKKVIIPLRDWFPESFV
jgi:hypothetical protein